MHKQYIKALKIALKKIRVFLPRKLLHLSFGRYFCKFFVRQNFLTLLVAENKGIYMGNEGLGFNDVWVAS